MRKEKYRMKKVFCACAILLVCMTTACENTLEYDDSQNVSLENEETGATTDSKSNEEAESDDEKNTSGQRTEENSAFLPAKERNLEKGIKRTFYAWMDKQIEQETVWSAVKCMDGFEKGEQLYFWQNASVQVQKENLNPEFLDYLRKTSAAEYNNVMEEGYYNLSVKLYTYPGCEETILSQSSAAMNTEEKEEYSGGSVTDYKKDDQLNLEIVLSATPPDKKKNCKVTLDNQTMDVEWYWDASLFDTFLSIPYVEYFELCPLEKEGYPDYYAVMAEKGSEESLRSEVENLLGADGEIYESAFYK